VVVIDDATRIVGALGGSLDAPLVALAGGGDGAWVVLATPSPPDVATRLRALGHPQVPPDGPALRVRDRVVVPRPWFAGRDLHGVRAVAGGALEDDVAAALVLAIARVLRDLHAAGIAHGGLTASAVVLHPSGLPVLLGVRGGDPAGDVAALAGLLEALTGRDERERAGAAAALLARWPHGLPEVMVRLDEIAGGVSTRGLVPALGAPEVHPHPAMGLLVGPAAQAPAAAPPKVRVAAVGIVMLALGAFSGWFLRPAVPDVGSVQVPGATEVRVDCDPFVASGDRVAFDRPVTCRVSGAVAGGALEGVLDGQISDHHLCRATEGALRCDAP
jgi:hypothetical protein